MSALTIDNCEASGPGTLRPNVLQSFIGRRKPRLLSRQAWNHSNLAARLAMDVTTELQVPPFVEPHCNQGAFFPAHFPFLPTNCFSALLEP